MTGPWPTRRLDELADVGAGNPAPQGDVHFLAGTVPFFRTSDVGRVHLGELHDAEDRVNEIGAKGMRLHPAGTVLLPKSGASTFTDHRVITTKPGYVSSHLATVKANGKTAVDQYLYYVLQTISARDLAGDSSYPTLSLAQIKAMEVPAPPLADQQRIVAILDEAFEGIAAAIASTERNILNTQSLFSTARKTLFSNRDGPWTAEPIAAICENLDGHRRPVTKRDRLSGSIPYYGASGVVDHVQTHLFNEDLLLVSEDGANLLARTYPIAFSISGPSWVNNHAHVLRFSDPRTQKFVEHYLNSIDLKPYVTGMAQPKLNQGVLNKILVPLPPVVQQGEIVASLERLQLAAHDLTKIFEGKLAALAELKQSILACAVSGELTSEATRAASSNYFSKPEQVANILAVIHWRHERARREKTYGHVKAQKALHFIECLGGVELGRNPIKDAAGPNDFPHMKQAETWAKKNGFFEFVVRGGGYEFKKLKNHARLLAAAKQAVSPIEGAIGRVSDLIVSLDSETAEVLATVYAAWNNLLASGQEASPDAIVREARDDWHPNKMFIAESKFRDAIRLIKTKGIVPNGTARPVLHLQPNLL